MTREEHEAESRRRHRRQVTLLEMQKRELRKSLRKMLDAYWGTGDGDPAPEFIKRAAKLSRWKAPAGSLEGTKKKDDGVTWAMRVGSGEGPL